MIMRLYFIHGGNRLWLSSWLERRLAHLFHPSSHKLPPTPPQRGLHGQALLHWRPGVCRLHRHWRPHRKFTPYSINAIALLTVGAGVLALHTSSDRPKGESNKDYNVGLIMMLAAAALYGLILPLVELTYKKARQAIPREAREFGLGETTYYSVLVISGIVWQGFYIGAIGVIFASSTLFSAIIIAVLLPLTEILAVIFYKEKFTAEKWVSLVLSLWGCVSYFYGGNTGKSMGLDEDDISDTNKSVGEGNDAAAAYDEHMTPAERRYMEQKERIDVHRLAKIANKSHRDRIQDFNQYLTNMSEHYDIPKAIPREARDFELGETTYYVVLVCSGIVWQGFYLGAIGVIFTGSSLLCAVIIATLLPVTEILAVIFYKEKFTAEKGVCLVLSLWGFLSYFYGELKNEKEKSDQPQTPEAEIPQAISVTTSP
ncbi:hypothetical protein RHSIM_Rhsim07G0208000 [Rhododendron simsii]|uniref:Probable purine permease n=1 Tax=Rhododendron simsii TaxID=118357 RepID=A0A834GQ07_RHOSS|nr:hypothetical protein RHSIM_Rhsim07G0207900 [Rhododendron simsii]KAF7138310.1 hypothetical protein RHSIM_Rhsim07G0208000 [Rhododendron simsii]